MGKSGRFWCTLGLPFPFEDYIQVQFLEPLKAWASETLPTSGRLEAVDDVLKARRHIAADKDLVHVTLLKGKPLCETSSKVDEFPLPPTTSRRPAAPESAIASSPGQTVRCANGRNPYNAWQREIGVFNGHP